MKLEPGMWDALDEICHRENLAIHDICTRIAESHRGANLTAATRAFILGYFRAAATEDGHQRVGHGIAAERHSNDTNDGHPIVGVRPSFPRMGLPATAQFRIAPPVSGRAAGG